MYDCVGAGALVTAGALSMSANGFPANWSRSSDALLAWKEGTK